MNRSLLLRTALLVTAGGAVSCFNSDQGQSPLEADPFSSSDRMQIVEVQNGFGRLLPYVVAVPDPGTGLPTAQLIEIRTMDDLLENRPTELNPILPPATWPSEAVNPANRTGNHFVAVKFSRSMSE